MDQTNIQTGTRFSKLFIHPQLKADVMVREIELLDSEFQLHRSDDMTRLEQLIASTAHKNLPFTKFSWGNKKSLSGNDFLHDQLLSMFKTYFVGASMNLVVHGSDPVDKLAEWVKRQFANIKSKEAAQPPLRNFYPEIPLSNPSDPSKYLYILKAVGEENRLQLSWKIPPKIPRDSVSMFTPPDYKRPEIFLQKLLGHRSEGSLYTLFKNNGWITDLEVSVGALKFDADDDEEESTIDCTSIGRLFIISLHLRNNIQIREIYRMVTHIYEFLSFVKHQDAPSYIMDEYFSMKKILFESFDLYDAYANMSYYYTLEQSISGDYTHLSCNRQSVLDLLSFFTNSNMSLDFLDKSLDEAECLVESWFNSYYKQTKIPSTITGEWRLRFHANQRFQFPPKNNFLPSLSPNEDHLMIENDNEPLVHKSHIKLWHLPDNDEVPSVSFIVYPALSSELKNQLMVHLYVNHLKDSLSEILYQGGEANFETSILIFEKINIEFKVSGFKENLFNYISEIWKQFKSFTHPYKTTFEMVKELVENLLKKSVLEVSGYSNNLMLQEVTESCYDIDQMLKSLSSISYDDFVQFIPHMSSKMFIEGLFKGDISKDESLHMSHLFEESVEIPCDQEYIHIPRGTNTKNVRVQVNSDINSYAEVTFQIGYEKFSAKKTAILKLFHAMIDHNLQDQLSAKEKLGYRVGSNVDFRYGINRFVINITSSVYDPAYLLSRIYNYVKTLEVSLEEVHEDTFKGHIEFLVQTCPDHDGDGDDLWDQITEKRFCQGFNKNLISELKEIRKKDVVRFVKKYLIASSSHSRILEVCIWGCKTSFPTSSV